MMLSVYVPPSESPLELETPDDDDDPLTCVTVPEASFVYSLPSAVLIASSATASSDGEGAAPAFELLLMMMRVIGCTY